MAEQFTAEDFTHVLHRVEDNIIAIQGGGAGVIVVALRIAANVMRPGVIEDALRTMTVFNTHDEASSAIRRALTDGL